MYVDKKIIYPRDANFRFVQLTGIHLERIKNFVLEEGIRTKMLKKMWKVKKTFLSVNLLMYRFPKFSNNNKIVKLKLYLKLHNVNFE